VHEDSVVHLPAHLSWAEAATLTCAAVTAWSGLNGPRPVAAGETVLTVGTGTVALFGVQLARDLGARVIAITSGEEKAARLRALGAAEVVDRRAEPDWDKAVRELTAGQGVDHVLEAVGPATLDKSLNSLAFGGHVAVCGAFPAGGVTLEDRLFVGGLFTIRRLVVGSRAAFEALSTSLERHTTRPVIDRVFGFDEAREAYRYFRDDNPFGKVVITLP
jgi:NADPH:quinone reductase-like Zn-dependent oxidoreductase